MKPTFTLAILLTIATALTACTDPDESSITLPSTTASAPNPTAQPTPTVDTQQQILDAYIGMQRAFLKASETANPDDPELSRYATDTALRRLEEGLQSMRDEGLRGRGEAAFRPKIESAQPPASPTKARVRDCMDTRGTQRYKANGEPYKDAPGGFRLVIADLAHMDGAWKVTGLGVHEVGSCALSDF